MLARIRTFCRAAGRRRDWEREMAEELNWHAEERARDLERRGLPPGEALRRARMEFGAAERHKEDCRASMGLRIVDEIAQDLRHGARVMRRSPGFTIVAVLSLALGAGANAVVFSVLDALILQPLPIARPGEVYFIQPDRFSAHSFPDYRDLRDRNRTFAGLAGYRIDPISLGTAEGAQRAWAYLATGNYFETLGIRPAVGRLFGPEDDRVAGGSPYAVLSYACWQNRFAGDPAIAGRTMRINTKVYTILGVAPRDFHGTESFYWPDVWIPMMMQPEIEQWPWLEERTASNTWVVGRIRPGVTRERAAADLNAIQSALAKEHPRANPQQLKLTQPGWVGDVLRAPLRAFTAGVMGLAALVLLAACVNLASLTTARAADRHRELAVRQSIGAGRGRILRQLLTESLLLAVLGGVAACGIAALLIQLIGHWRAPLEFPVQFAVGADARVLLFTLAISATCGVIFGAAPARQAWRSDASHALKAGSFVEGRRWAFRDALLAIEIALCSVLVMACFVAFRGLARAVNMPLGFQPAGVVAASYDLGLERRGVTEGRAFQRRALDTAARIPGVIAAAYGNSTPLSIDQSNNTVYREGVADSRLARGWPSTAYSVSPGYFRVMGTRLVAGREFDWHDDARGPRVAIVNQTFAREVFGRPDAVGRRFVMRGSQTTEVVGIVEDGKYASLTESPRLALFTPSLQDYNGTTVLLVRTARPEAEMTAELRRTLAALDAGMPVYGAGSLSQMLGFAFFPSRAATLALSAFGVLAIMLAVTGIYGIAVYGVARRVREIGIRVAVGASPRQVLLFVFGRIAWLLAAGSAAGLALGAAAAKALASVVYQASARDPLVLAAVPAAMTLIGLAAVFGPAHKATSVAPLDALRSE